MSTPRYKAAIIGAGNIGYGFKKYNMGFSVTHFDAYKKNKRVQTVAICDTNEKLLTEIGKKNRNLKTYTDVDLLLRIEKPDVVSICTPDKTHCQILKTAAQHPSTKAIWCEKPLAISLKQGIEMVNTCKRNNIKLLVNYQRRYDILYHHIRNNQKKLLGDLQSVIFYYSGGITTNGSHALDLLDFLLGECSYVTAEATKNGLLSKLNFAHDVHAIMVPLASRNYTIFETNVFGTKARLDIINKPFGEYEYRYTLREKSAKVPAYFIGKKEARPIHPRLPRDYFDRALDDLLRSLSSRRQPFSCGQTSLKSLELISALVYSAKHGGKTVALPFRKLDIKIPRAGGDVKLWQKN